MTRKLTIAIFGILLILRASAQLQLCSGSFGDPVIEQTFGSGRTFQMPEGVTNLLRKNGCPGKGEYTISNFLFGCGSNNDKSWLQMVGDHTGNYNGNYMLVNAESTPSVVYRDTARQLCAGQTYVFYAWISNAMQPFTCGGNAVLANLTFIVSTVNGMVIASTSTGDIPVSDSRVWKRYGLSLECPVNTDALVVSIVANPKPGCGSGFVLDDIYFRSCGPGVTATLDGQLGSVQVCADYADPFVLESRVDPGFRDPVMQWQESLDSGRLWTDISGATALRYAIPRRTIGVRQYRMLIAERGFIQTQNCRISSNIIYTQIHPVPEHLPSSTLLGCLDKNLNLPETDAKALSVLWTGPNGYRSIKPISVVPGVQYRDTGLYVRTQGFYFGCTTVDSFYLNIFPSTTISAAAAMAVCEGTAQQLSVTASGGGSFAWQPSTGLSRDDIGNPVARPLDSTRYKVIVTNSYGCKDSAFIDIPVYKLPRITAGPDKVILAGDTAILQGGVSGTGVTFRWLPVDYLSDPGSTQPGAFPAQSMEYQLVAYSTLGCGTVTDQVQVSVYNELKVPNAFTPNGDGLNDLFQVLPLDNYALKEFEVFNRFGQLVFRTMESGKGWDGSLRGHPQQPGVYTYRVRMINTRGNTLIRKGTVTLIR